MPYEEQVMSAPRFKPRKRSRCQQIQNECSYFAYGANMSLQYLRKVRKIQPLASRRGVLHGYRLLFNIEGNNAFEPGFAGIIPARGHRVEGVLLRLNLEDFASIGASEAPAYNLRDVAVHTSTGPRTARTLVSSNSQRFIPSRRYLRIMGDGAAEHGLSRRYRRRLQRQPSAYTPILSPLAGAALTLKIRRNA